MHKVLTKEFRQLDYVDTEDEIENIIDALFPLTNEDLSARPVLLERFPATTEQWNAFKKSSKRDGKRFWEPQKSLVIKVISPKHEVLQRWADDNTGEPDHNSRDQAWVTYQEEEKVVDLVVEKMKGTEIPVLEIEEKDVGGIVERVRKVLKG